MQQHFGRGYDESDEQTLTYPWLNAVTRVQSRNYPGHVIAWKWGGLLRRLRLFSPCNSETNVGNGEQRGWPVKAIE